MKDRDIISINSSHEIKKICNYYKELIIRRGENKWIFNMMTIGRWMTGCRIETKILLPCKVFEIEKCTGQKIEVKSRIRS